MPRKIRRVGSRSAATREAILDAAREVFPARGFDAASMQEIAERSNVHIPQLSYHFGNKLELWKAVVDRTFDEVRSELAELFEADVHEEPADLPRERLAVRRLVGLVARNSALTLLMVDEGKRKGPRMRWLVDKHVRPIYELTTEILCQAQKRGVIPKEIQPAHFHYILGGAMSFIYHQAEECKRITGVDPFDEASIEAHSRAVELLLFGPHNA